jgi:phytoene dehydrogenase-like protein
MNRCTRDDDHASQRGAYDAVVVGSGPNGLAAAITLGQAGRSVLVIEARDTPGGGLRSAELTLPGFTHDVCSAIHPLGVASPFFRSLTLAPFGLEWIYPPAAVAHPLDDGTTVMLERSVEATAAQLGRDGRVYRRLMAGPTEHWRELMQEVLGPLRMPRHPWLYARFGLFAMQPAAWLARGLFKDERAQALFAGLAAHSMLPLSAPFTAAFGLMLGVLGHAVGWPVARGGSQRIADALAAHLRVLGGEIVTGNAVRGMDDLPAARAVLFDLTPRQIVAIAGDRIPSGYRRKLRGYRYGAGVFKVDYALDGPIPWRAPECTQAATIHLGGTLPEIVASEAAVARGEHPEQPFVILAQQAHFDPTRAPEGRETVWAYCHVPHGSTEDMSGRIEAQIERFAPGFRARILARSARNSADMEAYNANYIGGDINGGVQDWRQLFTRPAARRDPYHLDQGMYICSASTPPGGGVHGMCGWYAAQSLFRRMPP